MSSAKPSVAELRAVCQPADVVGRYSGEHWAGRLYGRRVSIYVTWFLVRTGLSANAITILMALIGAVGAGLFALQGVWGPAAGTLMIQVYLILDCSDGEVARWRGATGATGIFLDRLGHYAVEATLLASMGARVSGWDPYAGMTIRPLVGFDYGGFLTMGLIAALLHLIGKVETDLVHVARAKAGLPLVKDSAETAAPRASTLARARRLAAHLPIYRLTGAVEASLIALALIIGDAARDSIRFSIVFVQGALIITGLIAVGHFVMILASSRLR